MAALAVVALFEILRVMGCHKEWAVSIPAFFIAPVFPILTFFVKGEWVLYFLLALAACLFVYMMWLMAVSVFSKGKIGFMRISEAFVAVTYVTVSFSSLSSCHPAICPTCWSHDSLTSTLILLYQSILSTSSATSFFLLSPFIANI